MMHPEESNDYNDPRKSSDYAASRKSNASSVRSNPNNVPGLSNSIFTPPPLRHNIDDQEIEEMEFSPARPDLHRRESGNMQQALMKITGFFSKTMNQIASNRPETLETNIRIIEQKVRETFKGKDFHVSETHQTEQAIDALEDLTTFYTRYEGLLTRQVEAMKQLQEAETQLSMFYFECGQQLHQKDPITPLMLYLGEFYKLVRGKELGSVLQSVTWLRNDVETFKSKAIQDTLLTFEQQDLSKKELDGYAGRYYEFLKKARKSSAPSHHFGPTPESNLGSGLDMNLQAISSSKSGHAGTNSVSNPEVIELTGNEKIELPQMLDPLLMKQLEKSREQFLASKTRYETISQAFVEKVEILTGKQRIDLNRQLSRLCSAHKKGLEEASNSKTALMSIDQFSKVVLKVDSDDPTSASSSVEFEPMTTPMQFQISDSVDSDLENSKTQFGHI